MRTNIVPSIKYMDDLEITSVRTRIMILDDIGDVSMRGSGQ